MSRITFHLTPAGLAPRLLAFALAAPAAFLVILNLGLRKADGAGELGAGEFAIFAPG